MADNPYPLWRQERCDGCRQGFSLDKDGEHIYMDVMTRDYVFVPCTAPSADSVITEQARQIAELQKDKEILLAEIEGLKNRQ